MLENLKPQNVFGFFEQLCSVPHGSGNTKMISDLLVSFAKERNLEYYQDDMNNVIIYGPASEGYENCAPVMLQGHMDMVCAKEDGLEIDMAVEPIKLAVDGDWVHAVGTSLGADDCIAVAIAMAVLDDKSLKHPALECVFTVDEETGMYGAAALDLSKLTAKKLLNLDSEEEGVLTAGCAGGGRANCFIPVERHPFAGKHYIVEVGGLMGGHSGGEIDKGRANANKLLARFLHKANEESEMRIVSLEGGKFDNVITTASTAEIISGEPEKFESMAKEFDAIFKNEYKTADPGVFLKVTAVQSDLVPIGKTCTEKLADILSIVPQGIREMSMDIAGLPQTSLNLGILSLPADATECRYSFAVRSSIKSQKFMLVEELKTIVKMAGGRFELKGEYPEWEYAPVSPFRNLVAEVTEEVLGKHVTISATHGGLETGFFSSKIPGLDIVAMGPEMYDIHSPRERLSATSVERLYKIVTEVLARS